MCGGKNLFFCNTVQLTKNESGGGYQQRCYFQWQIATKKSNHVNILISNLIHLCK